MRRLASWAITLCRTRASSRAASEACSWALFIARAASAWCNQPATAGNWSRQAQDAMAPIAPQSEWPQTTMSPTPSTATAYSTEALTPPGCGP